VSQSALFEDPPLLLHDDAEGGIRYLPRFVTPAQAACWFEAIRNSVPWSSERRLMYEREVDVPRLVARYRVADPALPEPLRQIAARVGPALGVAFNSIGLNHYRDGSDSVAPHHDKLHELVPGAPIALLSLGAVRRMTIRRLAPGARAIHIDLQAGSLLVMSHRSQLETEHGIPKRRETAGPRISVALRLRP
jgi:alkylated DNA repair dioxygenase AlkB